MDKQVAMTNDVAMTKPFGAQKSPRDNQRGL
jgi:hypothetical protein